MSLRIRPAAVADMQEAYDWYEDKGVGLGEEFLDAVRSTVRKIETRPLMYPVVHKGVRRSLMKRFPYGIYFVVDDSKIDIIACMHARRDPNNWRSRDDG